MTMQPMPPAGTVQQVRIPDFNGATRQNRIALPPIAYAASALGQQQTLRVGLIAKVTIPVRITFTTASTGTYAVKTGRSKTGGTTPYDIIRRVRVTINGSSEVVNCSWWGLYLLAKQKNLFYDYRTAPVMYDDNGNRIRVFNQNGGSALATSQTYTFVCPLVIPIALGSNLAASLLLAQSASTSINIELTWGDVTTDLLTLGGTTPALSAVAVSAVPTVEYFNVPADVVDYPNLSMLKKISEVIEDVSAAGDYIYRPPIGNAVLSLTQEFVSNAAGLDPSNLTNIQIRYSGSQVPYSHPVDALLVENYERFAQHFPTGVLCHKFDYGGILTMPFARDILDLSQITDIQFVTTINQGTSLTSAYVRTIREELAPAA